MKKLDCIVADDIEHAVRLKLHATEISRSLSVYTRLSDEILKMMIDTAVEVLFPVTKNSPGFGWLVKTIALSALSEEVKGDSSVVSANRWLDDQLKRAREAPNYLGRDAWLSYRNRALVDIAKDVYGPHPSKAQINTVIERTDSSFEENVEHEERIVAQVTALAKRKGLESTLQPDVLAAQRRLHYGSREVYTRYITKLTSQACSVLEPYIEREAKKSKLNKRLTQAQSREITSRLVQRFASAFVDHTVSALYDAY